jgi:hypothetical protein
MEAVKGIEEASAARTDGRQTCQASGYRKLGLPAAGILGALRCEVGAEQVWTGVKR